MRATMLGFEAPRKHLTSAIIMAEARPAFTRLDDLL